MTSENGGSNLREVLLDGKFEVQKMRLECYFHGLPAPDGLEPFTGAHFDAFRPQTRDLNVFTAADLYAVSALSVSVPPRAGFKILSEEGAQQFSSCLGDISLGQKIEDIDDQEEFDHFLGRPRLQASSGIYCVEMVVDSRNGASDLPPQAK